MVGDRYLVNIIISIPSIFPFNSSAANLIRNLSKGLMENGAEVKVHLLKGNSVDNYKYYSKRINHYEGIKFSYCCFKKRPHNYFLKIFEDFVAPYVSATKIVNSKLANKVDCVIIYTGYLYNYLPIILICKLLKIKIIKYSVDWFDKGIIAPKWWLLPKWYLFLFQICYLDKKLDGIISISKFLNDHYLKLGFSKERLLIMPNLINIDFFFSTDKIVSKSNIIRIGYSGAAPILNGVDDLIKSFIILSREIGNLELLIIGDVATGESQLPILKKMVENEDIVSKVIFTGRVASSEVPQLISSCDILILARKKTKFADAGFPTKLGEYFATQKPVILSKIGDFPDYFSDKQEVIFCMPNNPESLAKSLRYVITNYEDAIQIGRNGCNWAKENLDYKINTKKIYKFIESLQWEKHENKL